MPTADILFHKWTNAAVEMRKLKAAILRCEELNVISICDAIAPSS